jgi:RNA polymerase sigma factor (sigma-70 family)
VKQEEFEHIAPKLRDVMLSVGRSFFGNEQDAEDVAQDGMLAMLKYLERMDAGKNHNAFAVRIAKHCCIDIMRKRKHAAIVSFDAVHTPPGTDVGSSPHEELVAKETLMAVTETIGHLKPSERRLFELRQIEGSSLDDISEQTGIAKPSIKSMLSAARKKVFNELKERIKS